MLYFSRLFMFSVLASTSISAFSADQGFYASSAGAYSIAHDETISTANFSGPISATISYEDGFGILGAVGYKHSNKLRTEVEISYRNNKVRGSTIGETFLLPGSTASGHTKLATATLNLLYDFDNNSAFTPYIGGGLGLGYMHFELNQRVIFGLSQFNKDETVFPLAQAIIGTSYSLNDRWDAFVDYRYLSSIATKWNKDIDSNTASTATQSLDYDYSNSTFSLGLRYSFSSP